ncbi:hypothetical protein [Halomonas sp.]|uniref:hypothetical protein n=1 Tax=Halomonas sp. TaxID=1486246 RepID=UPI0025BB84C8|nr:hypothetical protein [Halomonas sp.]
MAIEQGIWKLADSAGEPPRKLRPTGLADEGQLEEQIMQVVAILNRDWLLIGRQVRTASNEIPAPKVRSAWGMTEGQYAKLSSRLWQISKSLL